MAIVEGFISEKVKEASHTTNLGEAHGADIVVVVRAASAVRECVGEEPPSNAAICLDDLEWDAQVDKN